MTTESLKDTVKRELPNWLRDDPSFRDFILDLTRDAYADRRETGDRFHELLGELRRDRERQEKAWARVRHHSSGPASPKGGWRRDRDDGATLDLPVISCTIVRMKIVADTNILLAVALDEPERQRIIDLTVGAEVFAPEILPYEIGNALSALVKRRRLTGEQAMAALAVTRRMPVRLVAVDVAQALQLATDSGIYAYDAYVLHCARALSYPLLTLDARMQQVGAELKITVLEQE
jgi:predicted nucleic acid-binding protein